MCLTYGRTHVLEEAIESFLRQNYQGEKELIILNDFDQQNLIFKHPQVKIINIPQRFHTVGEKRSACAALCSHDILLVWDDDDIYLPHRIDFTIKKMLSNKKYYYFFKPIKAFVMNNNKIINTSYNIFHSGSGWRRELYDAVRGYAHMGSGQDLEIELAFEKYDISKKQNYTDIKDEEIYYIYRWAGTETFHLSGFEKDKEGQKPGNKKVQEYIERKIQNSNIKIGDIELFPKWNLDYSQIVIDYIKDKKNE